MPSLPASCATGCSSLAERAGVKLKQIYVLPDAKAQMSNAFARGDNAVMLTGSLLKHLSKREVDGILAHEIGHLKEKHPQRNSWTMLIAIVVTNIVGMALASLIGFQNSTPVITFSRPGGSNPGAAFCLAQ